MNLIYSDLHHLLWIVWDWLIKEVLESSIFSNILNSFGTILDDGSSALGIFHAPFDTMPGSKSKLFNFVIDFMIIVSFEESVDFTIIFSLEEFEGTIFKVLETRVTTIFIRITCK